METMQQRYSRYLATYRMIDEMAGYEDLSAQWEAAAGACACLIVNKDLPLILVRVTQLENRLEQIINYASTVTPIDSLAASLDLRHIIQIAKGERDD